MGKIASSIAAAAGRPPGIPEGLRPLQALVNTLDIGPGRPTRDELDSPERLRAWLAEQHLLLPAKARMSEADLLRVRDVREAIRALLLANNDGREHSGALKTLNAAARRAHLMMRFDRHGRVALDADAGGVDAAIGRLLSSVYEAMVTGTWLRLKACRADDCLYAFYDESKNKSGTWCSMRVCGNRAKARTYRQRH